jgi:hypothetical protein
MAQVITVAEKSGAKVRFIEVGRDDPQTLDGDKFIRYYRQLSQGFGERGSLVVERAWVPEGE